MLHQLILHLLHQIRPPVAQLGQPTDRIDDQIEAVNVVENTHIEGGGDGSLLLVAPHMVVPVVAAVGQLMHQRGVAMISKDDGLILGEQAVVFLVCQAVGMLRVGLQLHQIHHVHHTDLQLRQLLTQDAHGGQRLQRRR